MKKDKWLAGLLNIVPGAGYLYAGVRKPFAIILLSFWPFMVLATMVWPEWSEMTAANSEMTTPDYLILLIILSAFVTDAYLAVEELNKNK